MLYRILTLVHKEMLQVWRDPKSRASIVVPPILQLFIFAFAATLDVENVTIGVLNKDSGEQSRELLQRIQAAPVFGHVLYLDSVEEIEPFIDNQKGVAVVSIDDQLTTNLDSKTVGEIQIILDGRKSNSAQIVAGYLQTILNQFNKDFTKAAKIKQQKAVTVPRNWFNPNLLYYWYNISCLVVILTMVVGLNVTALSVARERELGTFDQLLVSPLFPIEILVGKMIPGIVIGMGEGMLIWSIGVFVFGVPFTGSFVLLLLSLFVFICSVVGTGLFVSSIANTQQQAILGIFVILVPSILLSGYATPIENMPTWLQPVSSFIPVTYMLVISKGLFLKDMPAEFVLHNLWPMALIACLTLPGTLLFFRARLE